MIAKNKQAAAIYRVLFFLLAAFPIIPLKVMPVIITAWCLLSLAFFSTGFPDDRKKQFLLLLFIAPYFLYIISLLYDPDQSVTFYLLERKMSLLFVPFCFFFARGALDKKDLKTFFDIYVLSAFLEAVWVNIAILTTKGSLEPGPYNDLGYAYRYAFEKFSHIHPTYMAMMLFFAGFLNIHYFFSAEKEFIFKRKAVRLVVTFILLLCGILLGARLPFLAFMITIFIYVAYRFKSFKKTMGFISVFLVVSLVIILFTPVFKSRMAEFDHFKLKPALGYDVNSANIRVGIYHCAFGLLKSNWLTGYGAGGLQMEMNSCYDRYPAYIYKVKKFNVHNEFLNVWLCLGLAGIVVFLSSLVIPFIHAIKDKQVLYACFIIFFCTCCLTENLLSRQMGILFFAFFNSIFAFQPVEQSADETGEPGMPDVDDLHTKDIMQ